MGTAHIAANKGDIAKIVLMAGDPMRAKVMAEKFLKAPKLVSQIRGMLIYTGKYNGLDITIMGHGMGLSSIGIYAFELYTYYDVGLILRLGTGGSTVGNVVLRDIVVAEKAFTDSNFGEGYGIKVDTLLASQQLIELVKNKFGDRHNIHYGTVLSSNWFYRTHNQDDWRKLAIKKNIVAIEMEAYALYAIAKSLKKEALTILTISDSLITNEQLSPEERQNSFSEMFEMALQIAKYIYVPTVELNK